MRVFVYGTLTDHTHARRVVPDATFVREATLHGLHPVEGAYPTLAPGGETEGRVLDTEHVDALDEYEGVDRGLYVRVSVPASAGESVGAESDEEHSDAASVDVYVGDPAKLNADADWPDDPFPECVHAYVDGHDVHVD